MFTYPAMMSPPATPQDNADVYILDIVSAISYIDAGLLTPSLLHVHARRRLRIGQHMSLRRFETVDLPSAIERGAIVSAAPEANPIRIRAAKKLP